MRPISTAIITTVLSLALSIPFTGQLLSDENQNTDCDQYSIGEQNWESDFNEAQDLLDQLVESLHERNSAEDIVDTSKPFTEVQGSILPNPVSPAESAEVIMQIGTTRWIDGIKRTRIIGTIPGSINYTGVMSDGAYVQGTLICYYVGSELFDNGYWYKFGLYQGNVTVIGWAW